MAHARSQPADDMPQRGEIVYPNRDRAASRATKAGVTVVLVVSVALVLAVTIGGWSKLEGMVPVNLAWSVVYLVIAYFVQRRWARGLLPLAVALALLLLAISLIAGLGGAGTTWFERSRSTYASTGSLFGGHGFSADTLGLLTVAIAPVQLLLIVVAMRAFAQNWNIEVEVSAPSGAPTPSRPR